MRREIWIVIAVTIASLAILGFGMRDQIPEEREVKTFRIDAYSYGYDPQTIEVDKGDKVKILVNNTDTLHGISIPEFEVSGDQRLEFVADKKGSFTWDCANYCGIGHRSMTGTLIVN